MADNGKSGRLGIAGGIGVYAAYRSALPADFEHFDGIVKQDGVDPKTGEKQATLVAQFSGKTTSSIPVLTLDGKPSNQPNVTMNESGVNYVGLLDLQGSKHPEAGKAQAALNDAIKTILRDPKAISQIPTFAKPKTNDAAISGGEVAMAAPSQLHDMRRPVTNDKGNART